MACKFVMIGLLPSLFYIFRRNDSEYRSAIRLQPKGPNPSLPMGPNPTLLLLSRASPLGPDRKKYKGAQVCKSKIVMFKSKSNLHYTRGIAPKRVTSGRAHHRGSAPG